MTLTIKVNTFMGRPPGRIQDRPFQMRASDKFLRSVDSWRRKQEDRPSRAEAIRRLVEAALVGAAASSQRSKGNRRKATDMAAREIDRLGDQSVTGEERASRKRRLLSGPKEFRDMRRK
jgi:hypothetical protein